MNKMGAASTTTGRPKNLTGYDNLPKKVSSQIDAAVSIWKKHMGARLEGIYLHGSIALGAFNPNSGDIDILIVVNEAPTVQEKLDIASEIIEIDKRPCPLEMSAITLHNAQTWKNPGNCVFHYSDYWTERYKQRLADGKSQVYVADNEFPDADVTSYIGLINQSGIVLYGRQIEGTFADIPADDFLEAITADIDDYDFNAYDTRYFASNILILGRILSFKAEKRILSKYDAGLWMIENVPENLRYIPEAAMKFWFADSADSKTKAPPDFPLEDLQSLREYLINKIKQRTK